MSVKNWFGQAFSFPHSLPAPLVQDTGNLITFTDPVTILRTRLEITMSVITQGTGGGFSVDFWTDVIMCVGIWENDLHVPPTTSLTPISNSTDPGWLLIDYLYPEVSIYDTGTPAGAWAWKPKPGLLESFAQRKTTTGDEKTVWLTWEVVDPSGLINAGTSPISYELGAQGMIRFLYETP